MLNFSIACGRNKLILFYYCNVFTATLVLLQSFYHYLGVLQEITDLLQYCCFSNYRVIL